MATSSEAVSGRERVVARRRIDVAETKHSTKTTEFYAMRIPQAEKTARPWWRRLRLSLRALMVLVLNSRPNEFGLIASALAN